MPKEPERAAHEEKAPEKRAAEKTPAGFGSKAKIFVIRHWFWFALAAILVSGAAVFSYGIYGRGWNGTVTLFVSKVIPYPAAVIDGRVVKYADYQADAKMLERFFDNQKTSAPAGAAFPGADEIRRKALDTLIKDQEVEILAARYGLTVTNAEVDESYRKTVVNQSEAGTAAGQARAEAKAEEMLSTLYGLSPSEFKDRILRPFLLRQKLEDKVRQDDSLNAEKIKKAEAALEEAKSGKPFKDVVMAYSEDPAAAANGGDLGVMPRGLLPKAVEDAAFAMKPGEIAGVIRSPLGFHVIKVTDRTVEGGKTVSVRLSQALVKPINLDDYIDAQLKQASIVTFVH